MNLAGKTLQDWLDRADALGAAGRYFDAHEELEIPWKAADGDSKIALQGLIQLAAGLHRMRTRPDQVDGARYLLDRGLEKLGRVRGLLTPRSFAALERAVRDVRAAAEAPASLRFGLAVAADR